MFQICVSCTRDSHAMSSICGITMNGFHNLVYILLYFILWITADAYRNVPINERNFIFTQRHYNTTIPESRRNPMSQVYVSYGRERIGIQLADRVDVRYKITKGDSNKMFRPESKLVGSFSFLRLRARTNKFSVNRENIGRFELTIRASCKYKNPSVSFSTFTTVSIDVLDINEATPIFEPTIYKLNVRENTAVHSEIVRVSATDADAGINSEIYYYLEEDSPMFIVHPTTGVITLSRSLDFHTKSNYELAVKARDRGPASLSGALSRRAEVRITVLPVNYYAPDIGVRELPSVVEHGNVGTNYAILYVTDKDHGTNGQIQHVRIIAGDDNNYFVINQASNNNGYNIQVRRELDREISPSGFNLTIEAEDAGHPAKSSRKIVYVTLSDKNDHSPLFHKERYEATVQECLPPFTPIRFIKAYDIDAGRNGKISYVIENGNRAGWFSINEASGLISIASQRLDREEQAKVILTVAAEDQANIGLRRRTVTSFVITIEDCNDNAPQFYSQDSMVMIEENMSMDTAVTTVFASDADSGENGRITYNIANLGQVPFSIDSYTGVIRTTEPLDYESMRRVYALQVRATDRGTPYTRETETIVRVKVRDINDNEPQFEHINCMGYVARDAASNTELSVLSAIDFDAGNIISYKILSGNSNNCFSIDSSTGTLYLACDLTQFYNEEITWSLTITATDGVHDAVPIRLNMTLVNADPMRQLSHAFGNVNCQRSSVTDEYSDMLQRELSHQQSIEDTDDTSQDYSHNLHRPEFDSNTKTILEVYEDVEVDAVIMDVVATDSDVGYNGLVTYSITSGNEEGRFKIDSYSGAISVLMSLDREMTSSYLLNITAYDMGTPEKFTSTRVTVMVLDINDNPPVFEKSKYHVKIYENRTPNTTLIQVRAADIDEGVNAVIFYRLAITNKWFYIDTNTGLIYVLSDELDREAHANHTLYVECHDSGTPSLSSIAEVFIELDDVNDNAPQFIPHSGYHIRIREDLPIGSVVTTVAAFDPDLGDSGVIRYSLSDRFEDIFTIDRHTGVVRIIAALDYETAQIYNMSVKARDRGQYTHNSRCPLVIQIEDVDENWHTPKFSDFVFVGNVSENLSSGARVLQVTASDADVYNSRAQSNDYALTYAILGGSGLGLFYINQEGEKHEISM